MADVALTVPEAEGFELSVILVNFNGKDVLPAAVDALQRHTTTDRTEIIVVDSGSDDDSAHDLPAGRIPARVIRCDENVGFCRGNNIGAEAAGGRVLCFTQTDGEVEPGWDAPLLRALDDPAIAVAGGVVMKLGTHLIDSAGIAIAPNLAAWSLHENEDVEQAGLVGEATRDVVGVSPALLAVRAVDHACIGGFWETLWMYGDEPDYALRIRARGRAGAVHRLADAAPGGRRLGTDAVAAAPALLCSQQAAQHRTACSVVTCSVRRASRDGI